MSEQWTSAKLALPCGPGQISKPVWVAAQEFGQPYVFAVAVCWRSIDWTVEDKATWYLDQDFYHLDNPHQIAEPVTHWMYLPEPPKAAAR